VAARRSAAGTVSFKELPGSFKTTGGALA